MLGPSFRRKRNLIFKIIVGLPVLWFSIIGLGVVISGNGPLPDGANNRAAAAAGQQQQQRVGDTPAEIVANNPKLVIHNERNERNERNPPSPAVVYHIEDEYDRKVREHVEKLRTRIADPVGVVGGGHQPDVLDPPNPDHERLISRMKLDAEKEFRRKEEQRRMNRVREDGDLVFNPVQMDQAVVDINSPGEQGRAVVIKKESLSPEERRKYDDGWKKNAFNQYASDMISVHRTLPDVRDSACRTVHYRPIAELPDTSVIVIFHNEAWSVLLRTVFSVLDRSPPDLIREVILVDDKSDFKFEHLGTPLEEFVASQPKVRLRRAKKREGLIRARLLGASVAQGKVLTFLDSHCECAEGWLEPMLDRIADSPTNVITPVIDVLDDDTLHYQYSSAKATSVGGFDWNLQFNWHAIPDHEKRRRKADTDPIRSPTMAGGLFSIDRAYFEKLGTYDPGMDIWGGENLELSFRTWMCGGQLEIVPCSHVGHIFRKRSPYSWKTGVNVVKKNSIRLAEVWMDDYKNYYYERFKYDLGDYGDVRARKELRSNLQCKSFDWYIHNIYPELFIPGDSVASGDILNKARPQCLDSAVDKNAHNKPVKMWPCHNMGGNQFWMMSKSGEIRRDEGCMDYAGQFLMIYPCHGMFGNQEWLYGQDNTLRHHNTNLCMELSGDGQKVDMKPCNGNNNQIWNWKRTVPDDEKRMKGIPIGKDPRR